MKISFEYMTNLQYENKRLRAEVSAFRSGEKYLAIQEMYERQLREMKREIQRLKQLLAESHCETVTVRRNWSQAMDDLEKELRAIIKRQEKQIRDMKKRIWKAEGERDAALCKCAEKQREIYRIGTELEEERGKNQALRVQISRDFENSSLPSSGRPFHKKVHNSREKTGKKPGAQPGHKGHKRKKLAPTQPPVFLPAPEEILSNPDYYETDKEIHKQVIDVSLLVSVQDYYAKEYRNRRNGRRYHAPFPAGMGNEVNYGPGIKALAFYLNNYCNVSIEKTGEFLSELTDGAVHMSTGMINGLAAKMSVKTAEERKQIFGSLLLAPVLYSDATVGRVNGKGKAVIVCTDKDHVLYAFRDHKGHKGLKGTPVEHYQQILVHDHDKTYLNYGNAHQECLAHIIRELKGCMENEPERAWSQEMHTFLRRMIHEVKGRAGLLSEHQCEAYEKEYSRILDDARKSYEDEPPSAYYREGFNLQKRLREYKENYLYFLRHPEVDYTNNISERYCRKYKRKQKQAVTFRSQKSAENYCNALSVIETGKLKGESAYHTIKNVFEK